ncbi:MAG: amidohydrolase family protein [Pseudomonadota bacterium]
MVWDTSAALAAIRWLALVVVAVATPVAAQTTLTEADNFSVHASADGRLVTDMLGGLWILPVTGGAAEPLTPGVAAVSHPRFSPDGNSVLFQARDHHRAQLHLLDVDSGASRRLGDVDYFNQHPAWHPDGDRIVFSSDRNDTGFDLREMDVATGLSWRLTYDDGDELEPAWSSDGRNLAFVHFDGERYSLVIRWFDGRRQVVTTSRDRLSAPAWRPSGGLLSFRREVATGTRIDMAILSNPVLVRPLVDGETFFDAPVSWLDRETLLYTADGRIRQRNLNAWSSSNVPFRITLGNDRPVVVRTPGARELPAQPTHTSTYVLRVSRVFDGLQPSYRNGVDIVIKSGAIQAIEPREERDGVIVIDMDGFTALPGFIDAYAKLPQTADESLGPVLLSLGVTTLVTRHPRLEQLNAIWSGQETPGPRLLPFTEADDADDAVLPWLVTVSGGIADASHRRKHVERWATLGVPTLAESWQAGVSSGAAMLLAGAAYGGKISGQSPTLTTTLVSGLADRGTPGLQSLLSIRQSAWLTLPDHVTRRFAGSPDIDATTTTLVLGSAPSDLPPGLATHAEYLALVANGVTVPEALKAGGVNAARTLGMGLTLGRVAPGSAADIVIVDGDPLNRVADLQNVVAVVRNGRFYSAIGLLERVPAPNPSNNLTD